jgi:hypothetical protein
MAFVNCSLDTLKSVASPNWETPRAKQKVFPWVASAEETDITDHPRIAADAGLSDRDGSRRPIDLPGREWLETVIALQT